MAASLNRIILIGRLVRDPEKKTTGSGKVFTRFTIAVDRRSKNYEQTADFIPITTWEKTAEICADYLSKGRLVAVEGRLQTSTQTQPDGTKRTYYDVVADNVQMLESKNAVQNGGEARSYRAPVQPDSDPLGDMDGEDGESDMEVPF